MVCAGHQSLEVTSAWCLDKALLWIGMRGHDQHDGNGAQTLDVGPEVRFLQLACCSWFSSRSAHCGRPSLRKSSIKFLAKDWVCDDWIANEK